MEPALRRLRAVLDAHGNLTRLNPAWEATLGVPSASLEGTSFFALFEEGERELARVCWRLRRDGEGALRLVGRNAVETNAPRAERAERAAAARFLEVGTVAAIVAHDLNNVLTVISYSAGLLRASPGMTAEGRRDIDDIDEAVRHGAELVRQVVDHCRRTPRREATADLNEVVGRMSWMLRHLGRKNIDVDLSLDCDLGPAMVDEFTVGQALLNLAVNARDAMPKGGRLLVETRPARLQRSPDPRVRLPAGEYAALSVTDTGTGIPDHALKNLFDPFFTTKPAGTGLGLYAVRRSVERSGGAVAFTTSPRGSRFTLYFRAQGTAVL